jgi:peroxiredoxin
LTGSGDVQAAQRLKTLAERLVLSQDRELAHQGRLVLLGFRLNQLQEGQISDPQILLTDMDQLFVTPEDRGLVEFMALERCAGVLRLLGYEKESLQVTQRLIQEFRIAPNPELTMRAWLVETEGTSQLIAFNEALNAALTGNDKDPASIAKASAELISAFPSVNTLWHIARHTINLEFSGNVSAASEVAKVIATARPKLPSGPLTAEIDTLLNCHALRLATRGELLTLEELATFDGRAFDWSSYRGKVVLVCFWTSLDMHSLEEINRLRALFQDVGSPQFDIVAINLDDVNLSNAQQMVSRQNYPWQTLRSSNPNATGFSTKVAKALGVNAVPFVMLVDRTGRVKAIHARGEKTAAMIRELLAEK